MLARTFAVAFVFCGSACTGDDVSPGDTDTGSDGAQASLHHPLVSPNEDEGICSALPDDGPCALLCDRDALLAAYVPLGSCVVLGCELTDGREIVAHFCNPPG